MRTDKKVRMRTLRDTRLMSIRFAHCELDPPLFLLVPGGLEDSSKARKGGVENLEN